MSKKDNVDFNPHNRAFTGGVGKPTKPRKNDGRPVPWSPMGVSLGMKVMPRPAGVYERLKPYANHKPPERVSMRCPHDDLSPKERKVWRDLMRLKGFGK